MTLISGSSVEHLMCEIGRTYSETQISYIIQGTLKGLLYLHSHQIIHRDVKVDYFSEISNINRLQIYY
jgi:serine/threonine protein kinase